jgi:hypothetical protein
MSPTEAAAELVNEREQPEPPEREPAAAALAQESFPDGDRMANAETLLVFVHVLVKQLAFQRALQAALGRVAVTAVGRISDFERKMQEVPDAVLTLPIVLRAKGLVPRLQGLRQGAADETYALVGVAAPPDPAAVGAVGALDLVGRDGTAVFVTEMLGRTPKIERVTKVEDLLPLLQMQLVDAVLLPERFLPELRSTSRLDLVTTALPKRVGLPALVAVGGGGDDVIAAAAALAPPALKLLGVDAWR